jgi:hypothetical protein
VRVEDEEGSVGYPIITSPKRHFVHGEVHDEVWDNWVENEAVLRTYFDGWVVEWLD